MRRARLLLLAGTGALAACTHAQPTLPTPDTTPATRPDNARTRSPVVRDVANTIEVSPSDSATLGPHGIDFSSFELPIHYNDQVERYVQLYASRQPTAFAAWLRRMGEYATYVADRLAQRGLPRELIYVPLIESHYDPTAGSPMGAAGLWQFMAGTARVEGLEVSNFVDERRDPLRSTDAALQHLQKLHDQFGSWYLALAAYNAGSHRIARLLRQLKAQKAGDDMFWQLQSQLPLETRSYLPRLLAAIIVGEYPHLFGIDSAGWNPPIEFDVLEAGPRSDLRDVARQAGTTHREILRLNPHLIRGVTPPERTTPVRIPRKQAANH